MELDLMAQLERRAVAPPVVTDSSEAMEVGLEISLGRNSGDDGSTERVQVSDEEVEEKKGKVEDGIVQYGLQMMPVIFQQTNGYCYACMVPCWVPCSSDGVENSLNRDLVVEMDRVVAGDWKPEVAGGSGSSSPGTSSSGTSVFQSFSVKGESSSSNESRSHSIDVSLTSPARSSKSRKLMLGQKKSSTHSKRRTKAALSPKKRALVSTRGAEGEKIDGYLYECSDNRGVRILCECHRRFFSPSGFVRHAGGPETLHPLRQITVVPS
ncbi:ninja-family protein 1-like [Phalaenopsis equestris]|uniref:ninja-family protein 1-like n=1 Tax=Phalaenopsis equestris TaxID=78828 RepID=UPI0009E24ECE|nr:ninja-family protein 1-like [Phalaenopsis equestris]